MNVIEIFEKYNMSEAEVAAFATFLKKSNYKYKKTLLGFQIDDGEDVEKMMREFRGEPEDETSGVKEQIKGAVPEVNQPKLIPCPDCGMQVSRRAQVCIHCGCPLSQLSERSPRFYGVRKINDTRVIGKASTFIARAWVTNKLATGIDDVSILATGITKERADLLLGFLISNGGKGEIFEDLNSTQENEEMTFYIDRHLNANAPVKCPRCRSSEVVTSQRGYNLVMGFIGSGKTVNRCGKCGYAWDPQKSL